MVFVTPLLHSEGVGDPETFRLTYTGGLQTREKGQKGWIKNKERPLGEDK